MVSERNAIWEDLGEKCIEVVKVSLDMAFEIRKTIVQVMKKQSKK